MVWLGRRTERFAEMRDFSARITRRAPWIDQHDFAVFEPPAPECAGESPRRPRGSGSARLLSSRTWPSPPSSGTCAGRASCCAPPTLFVESRRRRANSASRGPTSQAISISRAMSTRRSPCSSADGHSPISSASWSRSRAILGSLPFAPCLLRPRRRACAAVATRRRAMRPRSRSGSRTTGMSQTASTTLVFVDRHVRARRPLAARPLLQATAHAPPPRRHFFSTTASVGHPGVGHSFRAGRSSNRYVFPDGELHEVGAVVSRIQAAAFEVRHLESLREHYPLTLRRWVQNLEDLRGTRRLPRRGARGRASGACTWRAPRSGSKPGRLQVHQVLAVRPDRGASGLPLRPAAWR